MRLLRFRTHVCTEDRRMVAIPSRRRVLRGGVVTATVFAAGLLLPTTALFLSGCGGSSAPGAGKGLQPILRATWQPLDLGIQLTKSVVSTRENRAAQPTLLSLPLATRSVSITLEGTDIRTTRVKYFNRDVTDSGGPEDLTLDTIDLNAFGGATSFANGATVTLTVRCYSNVNGPDGEGSQVIAETKLENLKLKSDNKFYVSGREVVLADFPLTSKITLLSRDLKIPKGILKDLGVQARVEGSSTPINLSPGYYAIDLNGAPVTNVQGRIQPKRDASGSSTLNVSTKANGNAGTVSGESTCRVKIDFLDAVTVSNITGDTGTLRPNETRQFSASVVNNGDEIGSVFWEVGTLNASGAFEPHYSSLSDSQTRTVVYQGDMRDEMYGTISPTGLYTAPNSLPAGKIIIQARSSLDAIAENNILIHTLPKLNQDGRETTGRVPATVAFQLPISIVNDILFRLTVDSDNDGVTFSQGSVDVSPGRPQQPASSAITITMPASSNVAPAKFHLTALTNSTADQKGTDVAWSVDGGPENGTIDRRSGKGSNEAIYTAPARQGTFTVRATSQRDPSRSVPITVNVRASTFPVVIQ